MKNYKVSVIVNCLNGERFVNRSIKSILNQSYQNFEIIFWDNKSIDNSLKIVKKLQKENNKIRIFSSKKTIKLYEARNKAIQKAKGTSHMKRDARREGPAQNKTWGRVHHQGSFVRPRVEDTCHTRPRDWCTRSEKLNDIGCYAN